MLGGLLQQTQKMEEINGGVSGILRDSFQGYGGQSSHGNRLVKHNNQHVDAMQDVPVNMAHESHYDIVRLAQWNQRGSKTGITKSNTNGRGGLYHVGSTTASRQNHSSTNEKPSMYRRTSKHVDSRPRRRYQPRGQQYRRQCEPYNKMQSGYKARKPAFSHISPPNHVTRYHFPQKYVPSNPTILPMICESTYYSRNNDEVLGACSSRQSYRSPNSPPEYSPASPAYQSMEMSSYSPPVISDATRANLKRELAVTILSEKLKLAVSKEKGREYDPSKPTSGYRSNQSRLEYDPASPQYY